MRTMRGVDETLLGLAAVVASRGQQARAARLTGAAKVIKPGAAS
jgi:hypothetical protein